MPDDEIKDWEEIPDENPPEKLQDKWSREEARERPDGAVCPRCKSLIPSGSFRCLHCGAQVFKDSGLLGKMMSWIQFWK